MKRQPWSSSPFLVSLLYPRRRERPAVATVSLGLPPASPNVIFSSSTLTVLKTSILLLQTLLFTNQEKTEAAITELLVGLNYIWRFEREITAKALFECNNFNGLSYNLQQRRYNFCVNEGERETYY